MGRVGRRKAVRTKMAGSGWEVDAWGGPVGRYELFDEYAPYRSYEYEADFGIDIYYGGAKVAELDHDRLEGDSQPALYDMLESAYMRNVDMGTYLDRYVPEIEAELRDCEETVEDEGYVGTDKRGWWADAFSDGFGGLGFRMLTDSPIPDFSERRASARRGAFDAPHASSADELAVLALRQSLEGENQAVYDYQNWVNQLPEGHPVREGLIDIMREERAHVGELQQMLFDMGFGEEDDFEGGRREVSASAHSETGKTAGSGYAFDKREGKAQMRFAYTVKDNVTKEVYDCETVGDLEDCLRDITPEDAPGYEFIDDVAHMANDNCFADLENALGVTIKANGRRRSALRRTSSASRKHAGRSQLYIDWIVAGILDKAPFMSQSDLSAAIDDAIDYYVRTDREVREVAEDFVPEDLIPAGGLESMTADEMWDAFIDGFADAVQDTLDSYGTRLVAGRSVAFGGRRRRTAGMYDIPGGAIETYQEDGRWCARAFQYGEYATGRCYGRSEEEAVNKCKKELSKRGFDAAGRRARRNAPRRANRKKVAVNGAAFSNGWMMYLDVRGDGSFDVTLYDPDGREIDYGKTFTAGDEDSLVRQLKGIMGWRAPMDADDDAKLEEMAAKAFRRYARRAMRMRAV